MQAYFKAGIEKDWIVIEGADTAFGAAQKIVDAGGAITSSVEAGYRLFTDYVNKFSLQYPKDWYWQKSSQTKIEFSDRPFPAGIALFSVRIVDGTNLVFNQKTNEDSDTVIYLKYNYEKSVRLAIADSSYLDVLEAAHQSFALLD
jgi:hypothetical protein